MKIYKMSQMSKLSYSDETFYLQKYLEKGFDPYDFPYMIEDFLEDYNPDFLEERQDMEDYDIIEDFVKQSTNDDKEAFKDYVERHIDDGWADNPPYFTLYWSEYKKPTWLVHFTDDADSIASYGFEYGHEDYMGLHLTTHFKNRKIGPGFNFAFELGSKYADWAANDRKYGKEAVVFWSDAVKAHHGGDQEDQMIFWGPSVNKSMIFPVFSGGENGEWYVRQDITGHEMVSGDFDKVSWWVVENYRMLQNISDKYERRKKPYASSFPIFIKPSS